MTSFFRYPGGKSKLLKEISKYLTTVYAGEEYREPFFGGGSVGLRFISDNPDWDNVWINDKDIGVSCLWTSLIDYPRDLKEKVREFTPSVDAFDEFKKELIALAKCPKQRSKTVDVGFMKLAIHQISYSGLGTMSGGPLGGREQKSKYPIDCRWSPDYICKKIDKLYKMFSLLKFRHGGCTNYDFEYVIQEGGNALLYVDPPYYVKGNKLYQYGFTEEDHERLSEVLRESHHHFVLSYDDCKEIRDLYSWADIFEVDVNYSITATKDESGKRNSRKKTELIICPK